MSIARVLIVVLIGVMPILCLAQSKWENGDDVDVLQEKIETLQSDFIFEDTNMIHFFHASDSLTSPEFTPSRSSGDVIEVQMYFKDGRMHDLEGVRVDGKIIRDATISFASDHGFTIKLSKERFLSENKITLVLIDPRSPGKELDVTMLKFSEEAEDSQTTPTGATQDDPRELYLNLIRKLDNSYRDAKPDQVYIKDKKLHFFLGPDLSPLTPYENLGCYPKADVQGVKFVILHKPDQVYEVNYIFKGSSSFPLLNTNRFFTLGDISTRSQEEVEMEITEKEYSLEAEENGFRVFGPNGTSRDLSVSICGQILVSTQIGLYYSFLKDPENIQIRTLSDGQNTLIADNARGKVKAAISASFYFKPRPINHQNDLTFDQRTSINFGLGIGEEFIRDYFLGLDYEIGWGLKLSGGFNLAEVDRVLDHPNFVFNSEVYGLPEVKTYKQWSTGWYFGIKIDGRILFSMLSGRDDERLNSAFVRSQNAPNVEVPDTGEQENNIP